MAAAVVLRHILWYEDTLTQAFRDRLWIAKHRGPLGPTHSCAYSHLNLE